MDPEKPVEQMSWWRLVKDTFAKYSDDDIPVHAAALAFYTIFSLAPLGVVLVGAGSLLFGEQAASGQLTEFLQRLMGPGQAETVVGLIAQTNQTYKGVLATVIGGLVLLFAASTVVTQLKTTLNRIWYVEKQVESGWRYTIVSRLTSMGLVLACAGLLIASLLADAVLAVVGTQLDKIIPGERFFLSWANYGAFVSILVLTFVLVYKVLPDKHIPWREAFGGAAITTVLFLLGRYAVGAYLYYTASPDAYGAAGSFLVLLFWVYYNSLIVFLGAEFTFRITSIRQ